MHILTCNITPILIAEVCLSFGIRGRVFKDKLLASHLAMQNHINCNIAISYKSETMFKLTMNQKFSI